MLRIQAIVLTMSGFVSYRSLILSAVGALLATAGFTPLLDTASAGDAYQAQRNNMIRLIESDVRATSAYLKRAALDRRDGEPLPIDPEP